MLGPTVAAVFALAAIWISTWFVKALVTQPVSRQRLERFAQRQSLTVTAAGGVLAIGYLHVTRQWRGVGLLVSAVASMVVPLLVASFGPSGQWSISVNGSILFVGWFAGAVLAEWLVSTSPPGRQRVVSVRTRRLTDYLPGNARVLPVTMWLLLAAGDVAGLAYAAAAHREVAATMLMWFVADAAVAVVLIAVTRRIITRPQRGATIDVIETDDAIRSRSLHVLAGSALAIGGYLCAVTAATLAPYLLSSPDSLVDAVPVVFGLLVPMVSYAVATETFATRDRRGGTVSGTLP